MVIIDKECFKKEVFKHICANYIYEINKNEYGALMFNVCVELPTIHNHIRKTTIGLKYHPNSGVIEIVTVTQRIQGSGKGKRMHYQCGKRLEYQLAWARTYLKNYGVIINSARSVWSITPNYTVGIEQDPKEIVAFTANKNAKRREVSGKKAISNSEKPGDGIIENDETEYPEEIKPWRKRLSEVLQNMDPRDQRKEY